MAAGHGAAYHDKSRVRNPAVIPGRPRPPGHRRPQARRLGQGHWAETLGRPEDPPCRGEAAYSRPGGPPRLRALRSLPSRGLLGPCHRRADGTSRPPVRAASPVQCCLAPATHSQLRAGPPCHPRTPGCARASRRPKMRATAPHATTAGEHSRTGTAAGAGAQLPERADTARAGRSGAAMTLDATPATAHVTTPSGRVIAIPDGTRLVFGRGPTSDLVISAGRGLSRRAGAISAVAGGAWVANISNTHALYAEGDGYRIRLPRMDEARRAVRGVVRAPGHRADRLPRDARRRPATAPGRRLQRRRAE